MTINELADLVIRMRAAEHVESKPKRSKKGAIP
jgi:hypothetical protein